MALSYRELTAEDWSKIPAEAIEAHRLASNCRVAGALNDAGEVVGVWVLVSVVHAEPLWIRSDLRGHPRMLLRLLGVVRSILRSEGLQGALAVITQPVTKRIAEWLGGTELPGRVFLVNTEG